MRHEVWPIVCNLKSIKAESYLYYDELVQRDNWLHEEEIKKDVVRTFQTNMFFKRGIGMEAITEILKAVSFAFPSLGYTQGMSFIAGMFSFYLSNEECFWTFVYLFEKRGMLIYFKELTTIERFIYIHEKLMDKYMSGLLAHLRKAGIDGKMYMPKYIYTFFASQLPLSFCCRIFDIFIFENEKIIFRALLAVFKTLEAELLSKKSMEEMHPMISEPSKYMQGMHPDEFIATCLTFTFGANFLGKLEYEYNSKNHSNAN